MKRIIAVTISIIILLAITVNASALSIDNSNTTIIGTKISTEKRSAESIFSSYQITIDRISCQSSISKSDKSTLTNSIRNTRNETLTIAGYDVFEINSNTYNSAETALNTDFKEIGLDPECSYLIVLSGEPSQESTALATEAPLEVVANSPAQPGASFIYTYNGTQYLLRYLIVFPENDEASPGYAQTSMATLADTNVITLLNNCANTALSAYISAISAPLGTVLSICGYPNFNFGSMSNSRFDFYASTSWIRIYTQVFSNYDQAWFYCSSVEYATSVTSIYGHYYCATTGRFEVRDEAPVYTYFYSTHYGDFTWLKTQAVIAFLNGAPIYNKTGTMRYKYGTTVKITHYENF